MNYFPASIMEKLPAKQANEATVLKAFHRNKTSTTSEYKGYEQELIYYPEAESMNVNNTFKKKFTGLQMSKTVAARLQRKPV